VANTDGRQRPLTVRGWTRHRGSSRASTAVSLVGLRFAAAVAVFGDDVFVQLGEMQARLRAWDERVVPRGGVVKHAVAQRRIALAGRLLVALVWFSIGYHSHQSSWLGYAGGLLTLVALGWESAATRRRQRRVR
jgi:hypothetical protein